MNTIVFSLVVGSFVFDLTIADLLVFAAIIVGGVFAWRYKRGDLWQKTAMEAQSRVKVLDRRLNDQQDRLKELEALPNVQRLYDLMQRHDEAEKHVWDQVLSQYENTALIQSGLVNALDTMSERMKLMTTILEAMDKHLRPPGNV